MSGPASVVECFCELERTKTKRRVEVMMNLLLLLCAESALIASALIRYLNDV